MERLVALAPIPDSVGVIKRGTSFRAPIDEANRLIARGMAVRQVDAPAKAWIDGLYWPDAAVVIMASGPSLTAEQCERVLGWRTNGGIHRAIAINTTFMMAPWADVLYACDAPWWKLNIQSVRSAFPGQLWTQDADAARKYHDLHLIPSVKAPGISTAPGVIHQGENSGFQAINLAVQAGARRIILLGYDMRDDGARTHWHGEHPPGLERRNPYDKWIAHLERAAVDLRKLGVEVLNATPGSALTCFPMVSLPDALA